MKSDDLTEIIDRLDGSFLLLRSPETAEHYPDYEMVARFPSLAAAERYVANGELI